MFNTNPLYFIIPVPTPNVDEDRYQKPTNLESSKEGKELFTPRDALMGGNAFKDEYRGYKNFKPGLPTPKNERQKLMIEIQSYAMVAHDLGLFLDVYPGERRLIEEFEKYAKLAREKEKEYTTKYGPLTQKESEGKNGVLAYVTTPSPWLGF